MRATVLTRGTAWRCLLLLLGAVLLAGCGMARRAAAPAAPARALKPEQYLMLSDREKLAYKTVTLRVPQSWGGDLLPFDRGPFDSIREKAVHGGELGALMADYNRALFELEHPRVRVEFIAFDMWSPYFKSVLAVSLSAHRAPSVYIARDLPQTIYQGMYADITDLLRNWKQRDRQPEGSVREGTVNGRTYTIAGNEIGGTLVRYRKDWFREAGIFNEHGEPGPRSDWTWPEFRRICRRLTNPAKKRWGFAGETRDMFFNEAHGLRLFIPDRGGRRTWRFNEEDPRLLESLVNIRGMVRDDESVATSVSMGWTEWHGEFNGGRAAMISSFSPHIPAQSVTQPHLFGKDKPFRDTVGMALPPRGPGGLTGFRALTNNFGFDPTLNREELQAAFDWTASYYYGSVFANNIRATMQQDRALGKSSEAYSRLLSSTYTPEEQLLDRPLSEVFPPDYLRTYDRIRRFPAPPLPREFGLEEPPTQEFNDAVKAMYSEAIFSKTADLRALVRKTGELVNRTMLNFRTEGDREKLRRFHAALGQFYRRHYPEFYRDQWPGLYERFYRVD